MNGRSKPALLAGAIAAAALCGATRGSSQEAATEQSCVYMGDVRRTAILDDNNILFYMRNGTIYQNHLRNTCFMLRSMNRFSYGSTALRRLCVGDLIQVLPDAGLGATVPLSTCDLGTYLPIDKDVADDLLAAAQGKNTKEARGRQVIKTQPVELPPDKPPSEPAATPAEPPPAAPSPTESPKP